MTRTLITSGTSAFSQRVAKLFLDENLLFADSSPIPAPFINSGKYIPIPLPDKASFVHEVLKVCLDHSITKLLPLKEGELMPLAESSALFAEYGILILVPSVESLNTISKIINPTRINCPEITIKQQVMHNGQKINGVFKKNEIALCCLK